MATRRLKWDCGLQEAETKLHHSCLAKPQPFCCGPVQVPWSSRSRFALTLGISVEPPVQEGNKSISSHHYHISSGTTYPFYLSLPPPEPEESEYPGAGLNFPGYPIITLLHQPEANYHGFPSTFTEKTDSQIKGGFQLSTPFYLWVISYPKHPCQLPHRHSGRGVSFPTWSQDFHVCTGAQGLQLLK